MTAWGVPEFLRDSLLGGALAAIALILLVCPKHIRDWRDGTDPRAKWFLVMWGGVITTTGVILSILYRLPIVRPEPVSWWYLIGLTLITVGVLGIVRTWPPREEA